jgi:hypothetical protein
MPNPFDATSQFPLRSVGPKGQNAFVGVHKVFFSGTTGLVATSYGIPGVTATRIATGAYRLNYPPTRALDIIPGIQAPSGNHYNINVSDVNSYSGTANFQVTRNNVGPIASGAAQASSYLAPHNPVSGTFANFMFFVSPITPY